MLESYFLIVLTFTGSTSGYRLALSGLSALAVLDMLPVLKILRAAAYAVKAICWHRGCGGLLYRPLADLSAVQPCVRPQRSIGWKAYRPPLGRVQCWATLLAWSGGAPMAICQSAAVMLLGYAVNIAAPFNNICKPPGIRFFAHHAVVSTIRDLPQFCGPGFAT